MHIHIHIYTYTYTNLHLDIHVYVCMCIYVCVYMYVRLAPRTVRKTKTFVHSLLMKAAREILHMGGCQNYGPFLDPYNNTAPNI